MSLTQEEYNTSREWLDRDRLRDGEVQQLFNEVVTDSEKRLYRRELVRVGDISDADPRRRDQFRRKGDAFEALLQANPTIPATVSGNGTVIIPEANAAARWLYYDEQGNDTQMIEWARRFPTAIALEPLQRPDVGGAWLSKGGLDERTRDYFINMVDGIGLRSRASIYGEKLLALAAHRQLSEMHIISLGSGAAIPNGQATERLEQNGVSAHWSFFDIDPQALIFAQHLMREKGFATSTFDYGPELVNVKTGKREPIGRNYLRAFGGEQESVDIVDALGLWEYLTAEQAVKFAKNSYRKLKPGGSLIVSNMLPTRPQLHFNQRAVGWPGLYLRGDNELLDIITAAGIDSSEVTITHPEDGVYAVMEVRKP